MRSAQRSVERVGKGACVKVRTRLATTAILTILVLGIAFPAAAENSSVPKLRLNPEVSFDIEKVSINEEERETQAPLKRKSIPIAKPKVVAVKNTSTAPGATTVRNGNTLTVSATGYCSCSKCCGPSASGRTASGTSARWGVVAADTRTLPFGTQFTINGHFSGTTFTVEDRGGAVKGNKIDIWFSSHAEALRWGRRTITITLR